MDEARLDSSTPDATVAGAEDLACALARGVARLFAELGQGCIGEFILRTGRRADLIALGADGVFTIVEIKTSTADYRADRKWRDYLEFCDLFYFAVPEGFPLEMIPKECGLIVADAYGAVVLREPPAAASTLHASRRRALTLRYAQTASRRLMRLIDPAVPL